MRSRARSARPLWPAGRNLFDAAPPAVYDSFLTYADPTYDFVGRYVYGRLAHKF